LQPSVGFGDNLFRDWRYNNDDSPKSDFVLTTLPGVLVGGRNFGSGSSREHAAWAFTTMVSDVWFPVFLLIFLETTV
jgi:3-isopropylmalate dehydratase small subunit